MLPYIARKAVAAAGLLLCTMPIAGCTGNKPENQASHDAATGSAKPAVTVTEDRDTADGREQDAAGPADLRDSALPATPPDASSTTDEQQVIQGIFIQASPELMNEYGLSPDVKSEVAAQMRNVLQSDIVTKVIREISLFPEDEKTDFPSVEVKCTNGYSGELELVPYSTGVDPSLCVRVDQRSVVFLSKVLEIIAHSNGYKVDAFSREDERYVKAIREVAGVDDNTKLNDPGWRSVRLLGGSHGFSHGIDRHSKKPIQLSDGSLNQSLENEHFAKAALRHLESADWFKEQELIYDVHQLLGLYFHELATNPHNNHYLPAYYSNVAKVVRVATVLQAEENAVSQETSVE